MKNAVGDRIKTRADVNKGAEELTLARLRLHCPMVQYCHRMHAISLRAICKEGGVDGGGTLEALNEAAVQRGHEKLVSRCREGDWAVIFGVVRVPLLKDCSKARLPPRTRNTSLVNDEVENRQKRLQNRMGGWRWRMGG
jgi:hypothetical protein